MFAKKAVEVAESIVIPPVEAMEKAVVVAPEEASATTWKSGIFDNEEVAEIVTTANGEDVPTPIFPEALFQLNNVFEETAEEEVQKVIALAEPPERVATLLARQTPSAPLKQPLVKLIPPEP